MRVDSGSELRAFKGRDLLYDCEKPLVPASGSRDCWGGQGRDWTASGRLWIRAGSMSRFGMCFGGQETGNACGVFKEIQGLTSGYYG